MYNLLTAVISFFISLNYQDDGEIKITFNSNNETRQFAYLKDTINIRFIPKRKSNVLKYRIHNISIAFEGITNAKELFKQTAIVIPDTLPLKDPIIKIPLKKYVDTKLNYEVKVYIDIESIQKITNGNVAIIKVPNSQRHREFTCSH